MPKTTKPKRIYPATLEAIKKVAANLPPFCDTTAARIDYLVSLGIKATLAEPVNPQGADISEAEPVICLEVAKE